ncbi:MAG: hypothetical protein IT518_08520 [Burkholderiales bacterium]|nr:hypothetical protein [Burkholderiales bacterium]
MKLTITLSPQEAADIHGWVNLGKSDPAFADHPYRIVLSERTRARYDEVAAQFDAPPAPPAPPLPVAIDFGAAVPGVTVGTGTWRFAAAGAVFALTVPGPGRVSANVDDGASQIEITSDQSFPPDGVQRGVSAKAAGNSTDLHVSGGRVFGRHSGDYGDRAFRVRWDWTPD